MDQGLSLKALGLQLGVSEITVGTWEKDIHTPPPQNND